MALVMKYVVKHNWTHNILCKNIMHVCKKEILSSEIPWNVVIDMWSKTTRISLNLWKSDLFLSKTTFADVNVDLTNAGMLIKLSQQYEVSIGAGFWLA